MTAMQRTLVAALLALNAVLLLALLLALPTVRRPGEAPAGPSAAAPPGPPGLPIPPIPPILWAAAPVESALDAPGPPLRFAREPRGHEGGEYMDVAWLPPYVFATGGVETLTAWRLDTPSDPRGTFRLTPVRGSTLPGRGYRLLPLDAGTLAVANKLDGLMLIDVRDPTRLAVLSRVPVGGAAEGMARHADTLLVARYREGLAAFDIRDVRYPRAAGTLAGVHRARDVAVQGDLAYVADGPNGVAVVSLRGSGMKLLGRAATSGDARRVAVAGRYVYAAMGVNGIDVVDVSDAAHPRRVGHLASATPVFSLDARDGFLYAGAWSHLAVYGLRDPAHPRAVFHGPPGRDPGVALVTGVTVKGPWVVASEWGSIIVSWHDRRAVSRPEYVVRSDDPLRGRPGETAPDFALRDVDGKAWRLSQLRGKTVLLSFFAPY